MKRIPHGNSMLRVRNSGRETSPTPERRNHDELIEKDVPTKGRTWSVKAGRWLDRYRDRGLLASDYRTNAILADAGEKYLRLASAAYRSACQSTLGNLVPGGDGSPDYGLSPIDAKHRLAKLNREIGNPHAECLMAVVYADQSVADWIKTLYRSRGWPEPDRRIGMDRLRDALYRTAKHWGML